jgi:hypothetical protein
MKSLRVLAIPIVLGLALALSPACASAAVTGPAATPAVIRSEGFETLPYGSGLTIEPVDLLPTATAYWGRITQRSYAGSYGLWCAGSVPGNPAASGWTSFGGMYPDFTYGLATFDLAQLSGYYSSTLAYRYLMPSLGAADADSFNVMWGTSGTSWDTHPGRPVTPTWASESWDLSAPANSMNMSRKAGIVRFGFVDLLEDFSQSPTTGEGATIDDVVVSGYKFGPVRSFAASVVGGKARLTWQTPWRSTEATGSEERPVAYRVWRAPDVAPYAWTELTSSRQSALEFDDPASLDGTYRYAVQAWDTGSGVGYGSHSSAALSLGTPAAPPAAPSGLVLAPSAPAPSVQLTWADNATGEDGYVVERSENGGAFEGAATLPADSTSYRDALEGLSGARQWGSTWTYRIRAVGGGGGSGYATTAGIRLDTTPPTTPAAVGASYVSPASITIIANDTQSGVAWTEYQVDTSAPASGSVAVVPAYGTHTIIYRAMDVAGNLGDWSAPQAFTVLTPTSVSVPGVSPSRPTHGKYATFTAYASPGAAAVTGASTLQLYRYETKTVRKKVRGRWRRVRVKYWRLRSTLTMTPDGTGRLTARSKLRYAGKWKAQVGFAGSPFYAPSTSASRGFTVR